MGDMADFIEWRNGDKPSDDDEEGISCELCGTKGLHWTNFKGKWYLFDENSKRHQCKRDAIDVFKEVM
jgi:hypothetical protein